MNVIGALLPEISFDAYVQTIGLQFLNLLLLIGVFMGIYGLVRWADNKWWHFSK